jgi:hypothetical protein
MNLTADPALPVTRLWDLPVRLVHWSFVALLPVLWWTAESGLLDLHQQIGLVMLALVAFRLLWGLIGSDTARFTRFVKGPQAIRAYLAGLRAGTNPPTVGHNPLGGWNVIALLALLAAQVALGLFAQDTDGLFSGPLNHLVSWDTAKALSEAHELGFNLILALVALHLAAIVYYRVIKRENLITPMITGERRFDAPVAAPRLAPLWRAGLCALLAAALALWLAEGLALPWDEPPAAGPLPEENYM